MDGNEPSIEAVMRLLGHSFRVFNYLGSAPYRWDCEKKRAYVTASKWGSAWWILNLLISLGFASFATIRFLQAVTQTGWSTSERIYLGLVAPMHSISLLIVHLPALLLRHRMASIVECAYVTFFCNQEQPPQSAPAVQGATVAKTMYGTMQPKGDKDNLDAILPADTEGACNRSILPQSLASIQSNSEQDMEKDDTGTGDAGQQELYQAVPELGVDEHKLAKGLYLFLLFLYVSIHVNLLCFITMVMRMPKSPELLPSIFHHWLSGKSERLATITIQLLYAWFWVSTCEGTILTAAVFAAPTIMTIMIIKHQYCRLKTRADKDLEGQLNKYTKVLIFQDHFNGIVTVLAPCGKVVVMVPTICGLYGVMKLSGIFPFFCGVYAAGATTIMSVIFYYLGDIDEKAEEWKLNMRRLYAAADYRSPRLQKKFKALRAIRARVGLVYYVDKALVLTLIGVIIENSVAILLADE